VTDQADTRRTTTRAIMRDPAFAAGVSDVRNGVPFDYNHLNSWEYERGRLWAYLAPTTNKPNEKRDDYGDSEDADVSDIDR